MTSTLLIRLRAERERNFAALEVIIDRCIAGDITTADEFFAAMKAAGLGDEWLPKRKK